jgi:sRNA-binding carbon storage regulator CsrA
MTVVYTPAQMAAKLTRLHTETIPALVKGMTDACLNVEGKCKIDCTLGKSRYYKAPYSDDNYPGRKPPHMRDTIEGKVVEVTSSSVRGVVGTPKEYAIHIHEGTSRMQARPFISDNIKDEEETTIEILSEAIRGQVRRECV